MKNTLLAAAALASLAAATVYAAETPKLRVGDPAPDLKVAKWFKGQAVDKLESSNVYVVEFWATWCGPCRVSIPHLTEVAKKFEGKAKVIGVSVWESEKEDDARFKKVGDFVTKMGDKMDYLVAADDAEGFMAKNWMTAAGENGIPAAFVVGKDGKVAWIGHPMNGLDKVLEQVIEGNFDGRAAAAKREKAQADAQREREMFKPITELRAAGKNKEALEALEKVLADHPELKKRLATFRFNLMLDADDPAAYRLAKELVEGDGKNDATLLYAMARAITDRNTKLKQPDYDTAMTLAQRASEIGKGENPNYIATVAEVHYRKREYDKAIETMQKAINLAEQSKDAPEGQVKYLQGRLTRFKTMKEKRQGAKAEEKAE